MSYAESTYLYGAFDYILLSCPCMFQNEPTLYTFLNVKNFCAWNRCDIWSLSDSNGIWTHNHLVPKQTLSHLAKLSKWLSYVVSTYLYGAFVVIMNLVFQTVCKLIQRYVLFSGGNLEILPFERKGKYTNLKNFDLKIIFKSKWLKVLVS